MNASGQFTTGISWYRNGRWHHESVARPGLAILSGSFNPLHAGHRGLQQAASALLQQDVAFELALTNVDKGMLTSDVVAERVQQFAPDPVALTSAATFHQKAALFPSATFVIGFDTATRLLEPRYYGDSAATMMATLLRLQQQNVRFAVAGRAMEGGDFRTLAHLHVASSIRTMFLEIPESRFRHDLSSTMIRSRRADQCFPTNRNDADT
jgi:hypothetical protein